MKQTLKKSMLALMVFAAVLVAVVYKNASQAKADTEKLTGKTAAEITDMMGLGWNLGNTLDSTGGNRDDVLSHEQSWGNPVVTKELIQGVKAEGFNTIRIPTTWYKNMDDNYNIDQAYIDRVKEIDSGACEEAIKKFVEMSTGDKEQIKNLYNTREIEK